MDKKHFAPQRQKGRGAGNNLPGRFDSEHRTAFDDGWGDLSGSDTAIDDIDNDSTLRLTAPAVPETVIHWDYAKSLISKNDSPDIPHPLSINPYRGCEHGCIYCFARPTHAYLGLSPGLDFETQIYAKKDAPALLRRELAKRGYTPQPLALGIITDAYQPAERNLKITRQLLEILAKHRHPVSLITKSALIERDLDILRSMAQQQLVDTAISITSLDNGLTRRLEARAAAPRRRLKIIENLAAAGIPVTVMMAPIIPAVTDSEIETLLQAAANAGAVGAGYVILRLPHELSQVFRDWLHTHLPQRAEKVMAQLQAIHGGKDYNSAFFTRHRGQGTYAELIAKRFERARQQYNLSKRRQQPLRCDLFRPPPPAHVVNQLALPFH